MKSECPRVLHLITELRVGGAERALARFLDRSDRERYPAAVACLYGSDSPVAQSIRALGVPVYDLQMGHKWRLDALWRLWRLVRRLDPTILHTWLFHANLAGRVVGRLAGVPIVLSGERTMGMESRWRYRLNRMTQPLADRVVCVSPLVADFVVQRVGVPRSKVVIIANGVNVADYDDASGRSAARAALGLKAEAALVGTVARLEPVKRLDVLLEALASLKDVPALIVGYGAEEERLKALARRLGLAGRVRFAGQQRDVSRRLAAMDVFVLSSDWEGMSNALLEAMATGLPVVATATGGTPDVVLDGLTGILVPPGQPAALARALETLLNDPTLRWKMGQAGRRRVANLFSVERMVRSTQELYDDLLREKELG